MSEARYVSEKLGEKIFAENFDGAKGILIFLDTIIQSIYERGGAITSALSSHPKFLAVPYDPAICSVVRLSRLNPSTRGIQCLALFSLGRALIRSQAFADIGIGSLDRAELYLSSVGVFVRGLTKDIKVGRSTWFEGPLSFDEIMARIRQGDIILAGGNWEQDAASISKEWGALASGSVFDPEDGYFLYFAGALIGDLISYLYKYCTPPHSTEDGADAPDYMGSNPAILYLLYRLYLVLVQPSFGSSLLYRMAKDHNLLDGGGELGIAPEVADGIRKAGQTIEKEHPFFTSFWSTLRFFINESDINHIIDAWLFSWVGVRFEPNENGLLSGAVPVSGINFQGEENYVPESGTLAHYLPGRILSYKEFLALRVFYTFRLGKSRGKRVWAFGYLSHDFPSTRRTSEGSAGNGLDDGEGGYSPDYILAQNIHRLSSDIERIFADDLSDDAWKRYGEQVRIFFDNARKEEEKIVSVMYPGDSLRRAPLPPEENSSEARLERKLILMNILAEICPATVFFSSALFHSPESVSLLTEEERGSISGLGEGGEKSRLADVAFYLKQGRVFSIRTQEFDLKFRAWYRDMDSRVSDHCRRVTERRTDFAEILARMKPDPGLPGPVPLALHPMIYGDYWAEDDDEVQRNALSAEYERWETKRAGFVSPTPWKDRAEEWE